MRRAIAAALTAGFGAGVFVVGGAAQVARPVSGAKNIVRISKYIISVSNADRSAAFYQGAFGIAFAGGTTQVAKAQPIPDLVQKLTSVSAPAMFRATLFAIPGAADDFVFEQTEFTGPARPSSRPRMQDPGASFLVLDVRDLDAAVAGVKRMGGRIVSTGGKPVENNGNRAVFAQDPDGAFIEIIQPPELPPSADSKSLVVSSPRVAFVVADAEKAGRFYRDAFGFDVRMPGPWNEDPRIAGLPGLPGSKVRSATVTAPGRTLAWQFYEYGGIERKAHVRNIPDPGAPAVGFEVRDAAAALEAITAGGGTVISAGGKPVDGRNIAFARDPNGVLLEVIQVTTKPDVSAKVIRPNAVIHVVSDVNRSAAFYRDTVGLEPDTSPALPSGSAREIGMLLNAPGANVSTATFKIPGTEVRLLLMQVSNVAGVKIASRIQDPGVVKLVLRVRDMDKEFARVRGQITGVYTSGGGPIRPEGPNGVNQAVITKDPDGCALEFVFQPNPPLADTLPANANVVGGWASFVVEDLAKTIEFYRDRLGFAIAGSGRPAAASLLALEGTPEATSTVSTGSRPPGAAYTWFMYDFRGIERKTLTTRLQDPGTAAVSFVVDDVAAMLDTLKAAGAKVETAGQAPVTVGGLRRAFVRDPSGILIELVQNMSSNTR